MKSNREVDEIARGGHFGLLCTFLVRWLALIRDFAGLIANLTAEAAHSY
jgi:hypothetical protein